MIKIKFRLIVSSFLCGLSVFIFACLNLPSVRDTGYTTGVYEGSGSGYKGPIHVRIQASAVGIEDISIVSHQESNFPGLAAMEELLEQVLETGETDLDAISGATYSSRGFLQAVEDALGRAMAKE